MSISKLFFQDKRMAWLWLLVRLYVGWAWLEAGWTKIHNPAWTGEAAGTAVKGFLTGALAKTSGAHPDVSAWYAWFIDHVAMPHVSIFSYLVAYGEIIVGIALIVGLFTGVAAFFGAFMNINYLWAGTISINPTLLLLQVFLIAAWRTAGWLGLDRYFLRFLPPRNH